MPVATRTAAAALHEATQADVLDLVLANLPHPLHQRDVCALLCTSAATAASVALNSSGRLDVSAAPSTPPQSQALSRWLASHGTLLRSLEVTTSAAHLQAPFDVLQHLTGLRCLALSVTSANQEARVRNCQAHKVHELRESLAQTRSALRKASDKDKQSQTEREVRLRERERALTARGAARRPGCAQRTDEALETCQLRYHLCAQKMQTLLHTASQRADSGAVAAGAHEPKQRRQHAPEVAAAVAEP